jgi:hypothetical protein
MAKIELTQVVPVVPPPSDVVITLSQDEATILAELCGRVQHSGHKFGNVDIRQFTDFMFHTIRDKLCMDGASDIFVGQVEINI